MKNKLGFLDFSNSKDKLTEEVPFNVDYIIKELLEFGNYHNQDFKSHKEKKSVSSTSLDVSKNKNDIYVPDEYKENSSENIQSPAHPKRRPNFSRKDSRMVCSTMLMLNIASISNVKKLILK